MNKLLLFFTLFLFSGNITYASRSSINTVQLITDDELTGQLKEALTAVFGAGKYVVNAVDHQKRNDGGRDITATINVFEKDNIALFGSYSKGKRIEELAIELPEGVTINFNLLNELVGGKLSGYLPSGFPLDKGVWVKNLGVKFGESGYAPTNMVASIATSSQWELIGAGSFSMSDVEFSLEINNPKLPTREITGEISALARFGEIPVSVSAMLSNEASNRGIEMKIEKVNLKNIIEATLPSQSASFLNATPQIFKDLDLTQASISIFPSKKEIKVSANSSIGTVVFDLKRTGGSPDGILAICPPKSFKFSSLSSNIAALDDLDMSGSYFIVSDKQRSIPFKFLDEASTSQGAFNVKKGFNLMSSMKLPQEIAEMVKVTDITLSGAISPSFTSISLFAELGLDLSIGENKEVSFDNIGAGLVLNAAGTIELRLEGAGSFKAGDERVSIYGGIIGAASPSGMSLEFEAGLAAGGKRAEKPESCIVDQAEWKEPFGIPGVGIRSLGLGAGIGTTFPFINVVSLGGNIRLGTVKDTKKHICGSITAKINIADVAKTMLVAEVQNMTPLAFIEAFSEDANIEGGLRDILNTGIESAKLKIVPKEVELFGKTYYPGLALDSVKLKFLGASAMVGFSIGEDGISAYGSMDRFAIEEGGMKLFAIEAARPDINGVVGGPSISLGLNAYNPHFKLDGSVTVLGITNETFIKIDKSGFEFETTGKVAGGALTATAHIKAGEITETGGIYAKVAFENRLQTMVADGLIKFIEDESKKSQEAYKDAKKVLSESKGKNDFEQAFVDLASETVDAFAEMDRGMAVAGSYVVEGLLKDALNIRKISFEGEVTSMKAKVEVEIDMTIAGKTLKETVKMDLNISEDMFTDLIVEAVGKDVIDFFGSLDNEIANAFEDLGAELETAFEDLGGYIVEGAEIVGGIVVEGAGAVADGFVDAGEYMEQAFKDFGKELEKTFVGDSYKPRVSNGSPSKTPYNYSKIRLRVNSIKVIDDEGGIGPALELYGSIIVKASGYLKANKGATPFIYGRAMTNSVEISLNNSTGVNKTKDFIISNQDLNQGKGWLNISSKILEWNSNVDYDYLNGSKTINIRDLRLGVPVNGSFRAGETRGNDEAVSISYTVTLIETMGPPPPPPSDVQMLAAARYGKINELNALMLKGGNVKANGIVEEAIKAKVSPSVVEWLYKHGNMARASQLVLATNPQNRNPQMINLLLRTGVRAGPDALYNEIGTGNINNAKLMVKYHAEPQLRHIQKAINMNNIPMVNYLLSVSLVQVGETEVNYAVTKNNVDLVKKFINHGGTASPSMITAAIQKGNAAIVDELLKVGKADHTSLLAAAERNNTTLFKTLTKNRVTVINVDPIHEAIDKNNMEILKDGITHGGSKDEALAYAIIKTNKAAMVVALQTGAHGTIALDYAVNKTDVVFFEELINQYHADVNVGLKKAYLKNNIKMGTIALNSNATASNHIKEASEQGKIEWVKLLLSKNAIPDYGLKGAVNNKHTKIVKLLLDAGAKVNESTIIHKAATDRNLPMVKMLVEQGGAKAENGRLAAINNNDVPMVTYLLSKGARPTGVDIPAAKGWLPMVKLLVNNKANPDEGMANAIQYNKGAVIIFLLDNGAAVKNYIKDAARKSSEAVIRKLLEKGANPTDGVLPAVKKDRLQIVKVLIDAKANVSDYRIMNAAMSNWNTTMVGILLANGGNTTYLTPKKSFSYLHLAADKNGKQEIVKLFLKAGADIDARNKFDETPLHLAVRSRRSNNIETVKVLIDAKANVNALTRKSKSVLQRSRKGYKQMLIDAGAL